MKYLLDSNVCIGILRGRSQIFKKFHAVSTNDKAVCSPVKAELYYGAWRSQNPQKNINQINAFLAVFASFSFDDKAAEVFGRVRADLATKGMLIGPYDLQIASIALVHGLILVTHNTAEFMRVPGLSIEDWEI